MKIADSKSRAAYFSIIVLLLSTSIYSQWNFSFSIDQAYNDNPFRLPESHESWISSPNIGIQKELNQFFIDYNGSFNYFEAISSRNYYWHQLGAGFGSQNTSVGIYAEQLINQSDYNIYDYMMLNGYFNRQFKIAKLNWLWSADIFYNDYSELEQLNNWEMNSNIRIHRTFPTRTTFIGGTGIYYKRYTNSEQTISVDSTSTKISASILGYGNQGSGGGKGTGGRRYDMTGAGGGYFSQTVYADFEVPSITQIRFWGRLAQSITATTGLAIQYNYQDLLSESTRFITGISHNYSEESQIVDDPMGYNGYSIGGELTQLLFNGIILKGNFYYKDKKYASQGVYLDAEKYDESILRADVYGTAWVYLQKRITVNFREGSDLLLKLNYQWIDNRSNSYWYEYSNHQASIGLEFQF